MITCPNCGAENREGAPFCRMCAAPLDVASANQPASLQSEAKASQIVCPVCKTTNEPDWAFCQECGYKLTAEKPKTEPVSQKPQTEPVPGQTPPAPKPFERETVIRRDSGTAPINKPSFDPAATVIDMQIPPLDAQIPASTETPAPSKPEKVSTAPVSHTPTPPAKTEPTLPPLPLPVPPTVVHNAPPVGHQASQAPPVPSTVAHVQPPEVRAALDPPMSEPKPAVSTPAELTTAPNLYKTTSDEATTIVEDSQHYTPVLTGNEVVCPKCAHKSAAGSLFCANCGGPLAVQTPPAPTAPTPLPTAPTSMPTQPNAGQTMVISSMPAPSAVQGKLHLVMEGGQAGEVYDLKEDTGIGRTTGEITFPHDGYMSGRHSRIVQRGGDFFLLDEGSRNGTFVRIKGEVKLEPGDMILVGKQLFRFEK